MRCHTIRCGTPLYKAAALSLFSYSSFINVFQITRLLLGYTTYVIKKSVVAALQLNHGLILDHRVEVYNLDINYSNKIYCNYS